MIVNQFMGIGTWGAIMAVAGGINLFAGAIGSLFAILGTGQIGLMFIFANAWTAIKIAYTAFANSFLAKAGALIVIVQFFRAIAQNITDFTDAIKLLGKGDFAGAISKALEGIVNVFVDLGFNLLEMLGISEIAGQSREEFHRMAALGLIILGQMGRDLKRILHDSIIKPILEFFTITLAFREQAAQGREGRTVKRMLAWAQRAGRNVRRKRARAQCAAKACGVGQAGTDL